MNFGKDQLIVFTDRVSVPLTVNSAGQYTVNVSNFAKISESAVNDDDESDLPMLPEPSPAETTPSVSQKGVNVRIIGKLDLLIG